MAAALKSVENFLFRDFPSRLNTNYYGKDSQQRTSEALVKRLKGYQKICLYGLGSVFWGATTGVLSKVQENHRKVQWISYGSIYFVWSLVLMLNGLTAATFPSSTPFALSTAGLGAWAAYIYMLATFHVASLQFQSNVVLCTKSMLASSIAVTLHWSMGSQDPLVFHIFFNLIVWLLLITLYAIVIMIPWGIFQLFSLFFWTIGLIKSALCGRVPKDGNSPKSSRNAKKSARNTTTKSDVHQKATV